MKKIILIAICAATGLLASAQMSVTTDSTAKGFAFDHGPYLLEMAYDGVTVVFSTDRKALSWVEVKNGGGDVNRVYASRYGLREANNLRNAIRLSNLTPDSKYSYRLCSKEVTLFNPYDVRFGDSIVSEWDDFTTLNPDQKTGSYIFISDMHSRAERFDTLLHLGGLDGVRSVFMGGDMINDAMQPDDPYIILDKATEVFAKNIPLSFVRGNHETRGVYARSIPDFFPRVDGNFYSTFRDGEILFIMLDCGEDKPDNEPVYAGCADFDAYRTEQAEWLAKLVETPEFKSAKYRIVAAHIPPNPDGWHGNRDAYAKWMPILNSAGIDLMLCGHTHRYEVVETNMGVNNFPVVIGSHKSVTRVDVAEGGISVTVKQVDGKTLLDDMKIEN